VDQDEIEKMTEGLTDMGRKILAHIYAYGPRHALADGAAALRRGRLDPCGA
jgi:hypothetical protein